MKRYNKSLLALLIGAMTIVGGAGVAGARMGGHGGGMGGCPGYAAGQASPELLQMMEKSYNEIAPMQLELRAKQQELTAKIYGGADDKAIQALTSEIATLQGKLTDARVRMQKAFAKAGLPMPQGGCMGGGMGMGGMGMHGGHGMGMHGGGHDMGGMPCPGMTNAPADGPAGSDS